MAVLTLAFYNFRSYIFAGGEEDVSGMLHLYIIMLRNIYGQILNLVLGLKLLQKKTGAGGTRWIFIYITYEHSNILQKLLPGVFCNFMETIGGKH